MNDNIIVRELMGINNDCGKRINLLIAQNIITLPDVVNASIEVNLPEMYYNVGRYVKNAPVDVLFNHLVNTNNSLYIFFFSLNIKGTSKKIILNYFVRNIGKHKGTYLKNLLMKNVITTNDIISTIIELNNNEIAYYAKKYLSELNGDLISLHFPVILENDYIKMLETKNKVRKRKRLFGKIFP